MKDMLRSKKYQQALLVCNVAACLVLLVFLNFATSTPASLAVDLAVVFLLAGAVMFYLLKTRGPFKEVK